MKLTQLKFIITLRISQLLLHCLDEYIHNIGQPAINKRVVEEKEDLNIDRILSNCYKVNKVAANFVGLILEDKELEAQISLRIKKYLLNLYSKALKKKYKKRNNNNNNNNQ